MSTEIKAQIQKILRWWVAGTVYKILRNEYRTVRPWSEGLLAMLWRSRRQAERLSPGGMDRAWQTVKFRGWKNEPRLPQFSSSVPLTAQYFYLYNHTYLFELEWLLNLCNFPENQRSIWIPCSTHTIWNEMYFSLRIFSKSHQLETIKKGM